MDFIKQHRQDNIETLALKLPQGEDSRFILRQIEGWQKLHTKVPSWAEIDDLHYPPRLSLEQCSSEATALYKTTLVGHPKTFIDLTGGLGVDFSFMAKNAQNAIYVERQNELCDLALHNFPLLGLPHAEIVNDSTENVLQKLPKNPDETAIFLDPARRDENGKKTVFLEDCTPNVIDLWQDLSEKSTTLIVKLSPMLDVSAALKQLDGINEVHFVAHEGEMKEILLVKRKNCEKQLKFVCEEAPHHFEFLPEDEKNLSLPVFQKSTVSSGFFLYEPCRSIMKSGGFKSLAHRYDLLTLHNNSHLFLHSELISDFPGRIFEIVAQTSLNKAELKAFLAERPKKANVAVRNFPLTVAELRKRLKINDGGDEYWFGTTMNNDKKVILAGKKRG